MKKYLNTFSIFARFIILFMLLTYPMFIKFLDNHNPVDGFVWMSVSAILSVFSTLLFNIYQKKED